jgi:hypothetical protein
MNGITLRRKLKIVQNEAEKFKTECETDFMAEIESKLKHLMETHVLEFDIAKFIHNGKRTH